VETGGDSTGVFSRLRLGPDTLFLLFALIGGLLLIALIPPLAGGNEEMNFQRSAMIANGHMLVKPAPLPGGIADLLDITDRTFTEGVQPPLHYSRQQFEKVAALKLRADQPRIVQTNPIAVLNPVSYLPQAPIMAAAQALGLSPLTIFYLGRLAGLLTGIVLTVFAIRTIPVHKYGLAAVALLPPILFSRSTLDADQLTNGLAFLFLALVTREVAASGPIRGRTIATLAVAAFLLAQAKSAYLLLPLMSLAIPAQRFGTATRRVVSCALITLPGILASIGWMLLLKLTYFTALSYRTWSGVVEPHQQLAAVLGHPLAYASVLLRTSFTTPVIPRAIIEFLGVFGPPVRLPMLVIVALAGLLMLTVASGERMAKPALKSWRTRALAIAIAAVTVVVILTLLYLQWTRFGGPVIDGFNGRYLYPLAPLLLLLIPPAGRKLFGQSSSAWLIALGFVSVGATWWMTSWTYLA
jgi:uncharacterized membrane protein